MYLKDFRCLTFLPVKPWRGLVLAHAWSFQYLAGAEVLASLSYLFLRFPYCCCWHTIDQVFLHLPPLQDLHWRCGFKTTTRLEFSTRSSSYSPFCQSCVAVSNQSPSLVEAPLPQPGIQDSRGWRPNARGGASLQTGHGAVRLEEREPQPTFYFWDCSWVLSSDWFWHNWVNTKFSLGYMILQ